MDEAARPKRKRNWWKYGCIAALVLFEGAREVAVLNAAEPVHISAIKSIFNINGYVTARGRWWRTDGNGTLVPGVVAIDCNPETRECIEASAAVFNDSLMAPEIDRFPARWDETAVSYVNDLPDCARYSVRIDWKEERAIATRVRKDNPKNENCKMLEPKLEMELGDGFRVDEGKDEMDKHFVPLLKGLVGLLNLFN